MLRIPALLAPLLALCLSALPVNAAFDTNASAAYVADLTTGTVLLEKNADEPLPPASMSKLMTLNMLFEALSAGSISLEDELPVSSRAKSMGGSTMFLNELDRPTVQELIRGIVVQSGNDATVVVAEGLAGTEESFARLMNDRARMLGMENSTFANASGWPDPNHRMSVRDLGTIASRLITEFPEYYGYFAEEEFDFDGRAPANRFNRNPLLRLNIGADGLKTGHTTEAGYGLVGSAVQGERRIVFVITGLPSEQARSEEAQRIVNWAFRQFTQKTVLEEGQLVMEADVWLGEHSRVGLVAPQDVELLVPALGEGPVARVVYRGPVEAPIEKGEELGELVIEIEGLPENRVPLVADRAVPKGGFMPHMRTAAGILMKRMMQRATEL